MLYTYERFTCFQRFGCIVRLRIRFFCGDFRFFVGPGPPNSFLSSILVQVLASEDIGFLV